MSSKLSCLQCKSTFDSKAKLTSHDANEHWKHVILSYKTEDGTTQELTVERSDTGLPCPFSCGKIFKLKSSLYNHLSKSLPPCSKVLTGANSWTLNAVWKQDNSERKDTDASLVDYGTSNTEEIVETNETPGTKRKFEDMVLFAVDDGLPSCPKQRKRVLSMADALDIKPFGISSNNGMKTFGLASSSNMSALSTMINSGNKLMFNVPNTVPKTDNASENNFDVQFDINSSPISHSIAKWLQSATYIELNDDMCKILNTDWRVLGRQRYVAAMALGGSILVNPCNGAALFVQTIEVYGRTRTTDAHCEDPVNKNGVLVEPSMPPCNHDTRYTSAWATTVTDQDGTKLIIATESFNALVTASVRLDSSACSAEVGPSTKYFVLDGTASATKCHIYLNADSWKNAINLRDDPSATSIMPQNQLYQLRQLRSKFDVLSTFAPSRMSFFRSRCHQPYTVFTYCDYGDSRVTDGKVASLLLETVARQVITDGDTATLDRATVVRLHNQAQGNVKGLLDEVIGMFEQDTMPIIGNLSLAKHLEIFATLLSPYLTKANKSISTSLSSLFK